MNQGGLLGANRPPRQYDARRWGYACVILVIALVIGWWGWNTEKSNTTHLRQFVYGLCNEVAQGNTNSPALMGAADPIRQELQDALSGMVQDWGDIQDAIEVDIALSSSNNGFAGSHSAMIFISGEPRMMLTLELNEGQGIPRIVGYEDVGSGRE